MSQDHPQAISFANSYFSLVDGLAPGLEDHLAQNVVLDWFGRTITGRDNVATFMKAHKVASRHVFSSIEPVPGINYKKLRATRNTSRCNANGILHSVSSAGEDLKHQFDFDKLSIHDTVDPKNDNDDRDRDPAKQLADSEGNFANGNASAPPYAFETTPRIIEEIRDSMEKEPQREEFADVGNLLERDNEDTRVPESSCIMYVEAKGQIEFSKKSAKRGIDVQKWKRQSKIQIAYTITKQEHRPTTTTDNRNLRRDSGDRSRNERSRVIPCRDRDHEGNRDDDNDSEMETDEVSRSPSAFALGKTLPSLEEITMLSGNLVPNINNDFGGYLATGDLASDREAFLDNFHNELATRNTAATLTTPRYVNDRLVFGVELANSPRCGAMPDPGKGHPINGFVFNFRIHLIIYEGSSRCRRSLTREFEVPRDSARIAFEA